MCAPHGYDMEQPSLSRYSSQSTSKTLVGGYNGIGDTGFSPLPGMEPNSELASSIVYTADNKQWIDVDQLDPKFLKELRRRYDLSGKDESIGALERSASKIKAWVRRSKLGFDIRVRRKINQDHDEVTDVQLVPDEISTEQQPWDEKTPFSPESFNVTELPAGKDEISELPDNSVPSELDAFERSPPSMMDDPAVDPLPRYEPRANDVLSEQPNVAFSKARASHRHSPSQSSIITTPTSGLSVPASGSVEASTEPTWDPRVGNETTLIGNGTQAVDNVVKNEKEAYLSGPTETLYELVESGDFQGVLKALTAASEATSPKSPHPSVSGLRVANTTTYETETDVELASPIERKPTRTYSKRSPLAPKRRRFKARMEPSDGSGPPAHADDELETEKDTLFRRQTLPKRLSSNAGAEEIWASLLVSQAKILGVEHPLVYEARSDLARSRANGHIKGRDDLLSLRRSKDKAVETLGIVHPWVSDFAEKLKLLESLARVKADRVSSPADNTGSAIDFSADITKEREAEAFIHEEDVSPHPATYEAQLRPRITTTVNSLRPENSPQTRSAEASPPQNSLWDTYRPPHRPRSELLSLPQLVFGALIGVLMDSVVWLQQNYGPEPPVRPDNVRVRWTCSCGDQLYDDFIEKRSGAARELEAYLNRPRTHPGGDGSPVSPSSSKDSRSFSNSSFNPPSQQTSWSSYNFSGQGSFSGDSKTLQGYSTLSLPQVNYPVEPPWLLTCANEDRYTPKLAHRDMDRYKIRDDRDLALSLREHYFQVNKKWWRSLRIRGLTTIEFVQLEVHRNRFADIRKCPDVPPPGNDDYIFEPSDLVPPVGSQYLLHLFKHPEDYDGELITYARVPKRNGRLHHGVGWGINLVEGFLAGRVWLLVSSVFVFASLVFAVTWSCTKHDVQGASGVAAWIVSLGVIAVGWLQAFLG